ncbi:MAG TPA: hypothetical protein VFL97_05620 [Nitrococcus sp.]|nr:hypothetical protein [Nitrococcus sp.]
MRLSICYTLMQLPATVLVILVLYFMMDAGWLSELSAALILCIWLLKDVVLYPRFRQVMRKGPPLGDDAPAGRSEPAGLDGAGSEWASMQGEHWLGRRSRDGEHLPRGIMQVIVGDDQALPAQARSRSQMIHSHRSDKPNSEPSGPDTQSIA